MDFNSWGFDLFRQHYGDDSISESHEGHPVEVANQPGSHPTPVSQLTEQLSGLAIGRGGNHAQTAPRTARMGVSGAFETSSYPHEFGYHHAGYDGSSAMRMDAPPPGAVTHAQIDVTAQLPTHYAEIMALLPDYERGVAFATLENRVAFQLNAYLKAKGGIQPRGVAFRSQLTNAADRARFDAAIAGRQAALADEATAALAHREYLLSRRPAHYDDIMGGTFLADLARGVKISDLDKLSGGSFARGYFKSDGTLLAAATIFRTHLNDDDQRRFDHAHATRVTTMQAFRRIGTAGFGKIAKALAAGGMTLDSAAAQVGAAAGDVRMFLTEEGFTPAGDALLRSAGTAASTRIVRDIDRWLQQRAGQAAPQLPHGASPSSSFFDFVAPGHDSPQPGASTNWQDYEQEAIWRSLSDHNAPARHPGVATEPPLLPEARATGGRAGSSSRRAARASGTPRLPAHHAEIMALLPDYGLGIAIPVLQRSVQGGFDFGVYFRHDGGLNPHGDAFRNQLIDADRTTLDAACVARQAALADEEVAALAKQQQYLLRAPANYDHIMGGNFLADFALGTQLRELERRSRNAFPIRAYFKSDGTLAKGGVIFRNHLVQADRVRFDKACADRSAIAQAYQRIGRDGFKKVAQSLASGGRTLEAAAEHAGVSANDLRLFLTDDGMTPAGRVCLDKSSASIWVPILENLERWQQQRQPQRQRTPQQPAYASPAGSYFDFVPPGPHLGNADAPVRDYEQEALWNSLARPSEHASPASSYFDFVAPGPHLGNADAPVQDYEQEALWSPVASQQDTAQSSAHAAGPSSSAHPQEAAEWEARIEAQARRLGIATFGIDVVGSDWRGASFVDHHGQPFAYAPERLAGRLAAMLHAGEIDSGDLIVVRGLNYRVLPIAGRPMPSPDNPRGLMFSLYPV